MENKIAYKTIVSFLSFLFVITIISCRHKHYHDEADSTTPQEQISDDDNDYRQERAIRSGTKVHMEKSESGVYLVPITVNGMNLKFIFDTGASSICISQAEAVVMVKQGSITQNDIVGQQQMQDATGGVSAGTVIRLHSVEIGGIELRNVEAIVVDNIDAPLLLGQTALSKFGKISIDYDNLILEFN
jgi:aspartyl protease family protein